jgi:hypothetical protein
MTTHRHISAADGPLPYSPPRITPVSTLWAKVKMPEKAGLKPGEFLDRNQTSPISWQYTPEITPMTKTTPTKAQLRAAVREYREAAHRCGRTGRPGLESNACELASARLRALIDALNIPEGE